MNEFSDVSLYNKKVKVDKLYCILLAYVWRFKKKHKIKEIAVQNFNWNNNVEVVNKIFETATIKVINKQLKSFPSLIG